MVVKTVVWEPCVDMMRGSNPSVYHFQEPEPRRALDRRNEHLQSIRMVVWWLTHWTGSRVYIRWWVHIPALTTAFHFQEPDLRRALNRRNEENQSTRAQVAQWFRQKLEVWGAWVQDPPLPCLFGGFDV